jgi:colanic acid biosynthesis protein WcaH
MSDEKYTKVGDRHDAPAHGSCVGGGGDREIIAKLVELGLPDGIKTTRWIPDHMYRMMIEYLPILCVDIIIKNNEDGEYLLVKRANEPLAGEWWVVGGRLHRGEDPNEGVHRISLEEVGIKCFNEHPIGYYTEVFYNNPWNVPLHTVSIVFSAEVGSTQVDFIKTDDQSLEWKFASELPKRFRTHCNLSQKMFL